MHRASENSLYDNWLLSEKE